MTGEEDDWAVASRPNNVVAATIRISRNEKARIMDNIGRGIGRQTEVVYTSVFDLISGKFILTLVVVAGVPARQN